MKNRWIGYLMAALMLCGINVSAQENAEAGDESVMVPTVAVLGFENRTRTAGNEDLGRSISELLMIELMSRDTADFVERAELDKVLDELHLSAAGLVDKETQVKIGRLVGAKILITGSVFKSKDKNFLIAKIIGVETGRVYGCSVNSTGEPVDMVGELADKVDEKLREKLTEILPRERDTAGVLKVLATEDISGNGRKVYVSVKEDISMPVIDLAAETELKKLLIDLGFEVVDRPSNADFLLTGEGLATQSGTFKQLFSATARLELTLRSGDKVLATDRQTEVVAGASYPIAAKNALAQAALVSAERMLPAIPAK